MASVKELRLRIKSEDRELKVAFAKLTSVAGTSGTAGLTEDRQDVASELDRRRFDLPYRDRNLVGQRFVSYRDGGITVADCRKSPLHIHACHGWITNDISRYGGQVGGFALSGIVRMGLADQQLSLLELTIEDHVIKGGYGSIVRDHLGDCGITTPVVRIGWPDQFIEHASSVGYLREKHGLTGANTAEQIRQALGQASEASARPNPALGQAVGG